MGIIIPFNGWRNWGLAKFFKLLKCTKREQGSKSKKQPLNPLPVHNMLCRALEDISPMGNISRSWDTDSCIQPKKSLWPSFFSTMKVWLPASGNISKALCFAWRKTRVRPRWGVFFYLYEYFHGKSNIIAASILQVKV